EKHVYDGVEDVAATKDEPRAYGASIDSAKHDKEGFTFGEIEASAGKTDATAGTVKGTMPNAAVTVTYTYTRNNYDWTINHYEVGTTNIVAEADGGKQAFGSAVTVADYVKQDIAGFAYDSASAEAIAITVDAAANVANIFYLRLYQTVAGTKTWVDENNAYGTRPTSVTVELLDAGGNVVGTTTATEEAGWSYSFGGLDYFGSYTVREVAVPNYAGTVSGSNLTNTLSGGVTSVSGEKRWANDTAAARPASVTIALYADGVATGQTLEATAANNWAYTFENVPLYAGGKQILYTVQEATVPAGYASSASGMNLTNTANDYTLTVRYWYDAVDGERAAADYVGTHAYASYYSVTSPDVRTGWAPDKATVTGNMPASDVVADVIYTEQNYALTVNYTYAETGAEAAPTYREKALKAGEKYNVTSPEIPDYKNTKPVVKGTMPAHNVKVTVTYLADGTATVEITPYGVPLGLGAISANVGDCVE
ncbi:MAG: Cna B-type domain-containing protein, partial [Clostridia bacterium]